MTLSNNIISNADQECVSFLMTLKHRAVTPPLSSRPRPRSSFSSSSINDRTNSNTPTENETNSNVPTLNSSMPIATEEDPMYLSPAQCFIRMHCCEFFVSDGGPAMTCTFSDEGNNAFYQDFSPSSSKMRMLSTSCGSIGGGRGPVSAGRVGIRCSFCKHAPSHLRSAQSMSFPSNLSGICGSVGMIQCRHISQCPMVPNDVRDELIVLKQRGSRNGGHHWAGRQQFWVDSAKKLGLFDTEDGIRLINYQNDHAATFQSPSFISNTINGPGSGSSEQTMTPWASNINYHLVHSNSSIKTNNSNSMSPRRPLVSCENINATRNPNSFHDTMSGSMSPPSIWNQSKTTKNDASYDCFDTLEDYRKFRSNNNQNKVQAITKSDDHRSKGNNTNVKNTDSSITDEKLMKLVGDTTLVEIQDKDLVPDFLYLAMAQMQPCQLTEADRVGCYKEREIGFLGMSCKHCGGQPGFGKYFPGSVRSLAQTTTSQTIVKHIAVKCRLCPPEIRLAVASLQNEQLNADRALKDSKSSFESRPRYGSRKIFFQRLWSRLHGKEKPLLEPTVSKASRAVVSPNLDNSFSSCPKNFHGMWSSSIPRDVCANENMMGNQLRGFYQSNQSQKRSRAVSYLQEEHGLHPQCKMSRVVSDD